MTVDKRPPGIATAFRNFDYEEEIARLKRSGGGGSTSSTVWFQQSGWSSAVDCTSGWLTLPIAAGVQDPSNNFSLPGTGGIRVRDAGQYAVLASVYAGSPTVLHTTIGFTANAANYLGEAYHNDAQYKILTPVAIVNCAANQIIYVTASGSSSVNVREFAIWRLGGAKGDTGATGTTGATGATGAKGDPGTPGVAEAWQAQAGAPANNSGNVGDWSLDTTSGDVHEKTAAAVWTLRGNIRGPQGIQGVQGLTGPIGVPGSKWYNGSGNPSSSLGVNGDYYLDDDNGYVYNKVNGNWQTVAFLHGTPVWKGDWWNGEIYNSGDAVAYQGRSYVAKQSLTGDSQSPLTYPSGWSLMADKGATGATGAQGIQGIPGGTMGAAVYRSLQGPALASGSVWAVMDPRAAGVVIEPPGSIIENADKTISVLNAGWYDFALQIVSVTAGGTPAAYDGGIHVGLSASANGYELGTAESRGSAQTAAQASLATTIKLTPADKIFVNAYANTGIYMAISHLTVTRVGGPAGLMEVYSQPATPPAGAQIGAIWVDTDDGAPAAIAAKIAQTYAMTAGYTKDRAMNPAATTLNEVAAILATLIDDMKTAGLINP